MSEGCDPRGVCVCVCECVSVWVCSVLSRDPPFFPCPSHTLSIPHLVAKESICLSYANIYVMQNVAMMANCRKKSLGRVKISLRRVGYGQNGGNRTSWPFYTAKVDLSLHLKLEGILVRVQDTELWNECSCWVEIAIYLDIRAAPKARSHLL